MDYLVTLNKDLSLEGYASVSSLDKVSIVDETTVVLLNSFEEDSYNASLKITDLNNSLGVTNFIYISETPVDTVKVLVESLKGVWEEDESLLSDIDEITDLVSVFKGESTALTVTTENELQSDSSFHLLVEFLEKFETGDDSLDDPFYLEVVNRAVRNIKNQVQIQNEREGQLSKGVIETYQSTLEVINQLRHESADLKRKVEEIETTRSFKMGAIEHLSYYPPVSYQGSTPMAVFKELSACRYLTSYVLAYANHLRTVRSKRVKVIIIIGKQETVRTKYENMFELTKDSYKTGKAILSNTTYTSTPIKSMINHVTNQSDEVILVIDRTYDKSPIITGKTKLYYGVSSFNEIRSHKLDKSKCILTMREVRGVLATIKHIPGFPSEEDNRLDKYERTFNESFNKLDKDLIVF